MYCLRQWFFVLFFCFFGTSGFAYSEWEFGFLRRLIPTTNFCSDSDGGLRYYRKGSTIVRERKTDPNAEWHTDSCRMEELTEYYCNLRKNRSGNTYTVGSRNFTCPYGCREGACLKPPRNIYVDGAFEGAQRGTEASPYRSIQTALNAAHSGDTVIVLPGLYFEEIAMKEGVKLLSPKTGGAVLHGGGNREEGIPTITMARNAEVTGFTITGGFVGIYCRAPGGKIKRNIIRGNHGKGGIVAEGNCNASVTNNTILGNLGNADGISFGLWVENARPTILNNIIIGNSIGYQAVGENRPREDYNDVWENRTDFGEGTEPGPHTLSQDPMFMKTEFDDYRLNFRSPVRNAGSPEEVYNDSDGSRNDMGAFDGEGGYAVNVASQEYFMESILGAIDTEEGPLFNGTSRFTEDPVFWFDASAAGTRGEQDARTLLARAVPEFTNSLYQARFWDGNEPPENRCNVVTVSIRGGHRGNPYFENPQGNCLVLPDREAELRREGHSITGGLLDFFSMVDGIGQDRGKISGFLHELGHVGGLQHSLRGLTIMKQGENPRFYSAEELNAFFLLYSYPPGTSLEQFLADDKITRNALHPFPRIDAVLHQERAEEGGLRMDGDEEVIRWERTAQAQRGEMIILKGSRLTLRWGTEFLLDFRPPNYEEERPVVYFGDIAVRPDLSREAQSNFSGAPAAYLSVIIPQEATSGWVYVKSRGLESNPVYLEILP